MNRKADPVRTGGDVDGWCTRCKMDLRHTIVAMVGREIVQVVCKTCGSQHKYRPERGASTRRATGQPAGRSREARPAPPPAASRAARAAAETARERLERWKALTDNEGEAARTARTYNMREAFAVDELMHHPKFGLGKVVELQGADKAVVFFRDGEKTLAVNRS